MLKTLEKRHENALSLYEGKQAKLPQVIKSYDDEINVLKNQIRQAKMSYKEMENRYKSQSTELLSIQKQHKHLLELSKDKQLSKREQLTDQLADAQNTIKQQYNKMQVNFIISNNIKNNKYIFTQSDSYNVIRSFCPLKKSYFVAIN